MSITYRTVITRLTEHGIAHHSLELADGSLIIVSSYGGRVYGPFRDVDQPSETWLPPQFHSAADFAQLMASGQWNVGGERVWIGPEITYIIEERKDYWGTFVVPKVIDPAEHVVEGTDPIALRREGRVRARHTGSGEVSWSLSLEVSPVPSPFRFLGDPAEPLRTLPCAGYAVTVGLERGKTKAPMETWDIVQVLAGGKALIPSVKVAEVTDYYEPVGMLLSRPPGGIAVSLTGRDQFKIGMKAPHTFGRSGYLRKLDDQRYALLVRSFSSRPEGPYGEEPDFAPGVMGDAIHLYNDDGALGGFAEIESRGTPTGADTGRSSSVDTFTSWWFFGERDEIDRAANHLLGMGVDALETQ